MGVGCPCFFGQTLPQNLELQLTRCTYIYICLYLISWDEANLRTYSQIISGCAIWTILRFSSKEGMPEWWSLNHLLTPLTSIHLVRERTNQLNQVWLKAPCFIFVVSQLPWVCSKSYNSFFLDRWAPWVFPSTWMEFTYNQQPLVDFKKPWHPKGEFPLQTTVEKVFFVGTSKKNNGFFRCHLPLLRPQPENWKFWGMTFLDDEMIRYKSVGRWCGRYQAPMICEAASVSWNESILDHHLVVVVPASRPERFCSILFSLKFTRAIPIYCSSGGGYA